MPPKGSKKAKPLATGANPPKASNAPASQIPVPKKSGKGRKPVTAGVPGVPGGAFLAVGTDTKETHTRFEAKRKLVLAPFSQPALTQWDAEWREHLSSLDIRQDEVWSNVQKITRNLENAAILNIVEVTRPSDFEKTIESLLSAPPLPHRNIEKLTQAPIEGKDSWRIRWKLDDQGPYSTIGKVKSIGDMVPFDLVRKGDTATIKKVAEELRKIHNVWPYPDSDATTRAAFAAIAVKRATGQDRKLIQQPNYQPEGMITNLRYIDYDTGLAKVCRLALAPSEGNFENCLPIPDLPSNAVLFAPNASKGVSVLRKDSKGHWPSCKPKKLPETVRKEHFDQCECFMLYVTEKLTGLVTKIEHIDQVFSMQKRLFQIPAQGSDQRGVFGRANLFTVQEMGHAQRGYILSLSAAATPTLSEPCGTITVRSLESPRVTEAMNAGLGQFLVRPDPRWAFFAGAKMADQVNMDIDQGIPTMPADDCTTAEKQHTLHHCGRCLEITPCRLLELNLDEVRVCPVCIGKDMPRHKDVVEKRIRESLNLSFRKEGTANNLDPAEEQAMRDEAVTEMLNDLPSQEATTAYHDTYANHELVPFGSEFAHSRDPDTPVVDAVLPRVLTKEKKIRRHAPGNLAITRDPTNRGKWDQIPGYVQVIGQWLGAKPQERLHTDALELMKTATEMQQVRLKRSQRFRLETEGLYTPEQLLRERAEYLSGRPCQDENEHWARQSERFVQHKIPPVAKGFIWTAKQRGNFEKLAKQYEHDYRVTLQRSPDGCPYIGLADTIEPGYSWNGAAILCQERLERMRLSCNKRHATIDTEYTLFAETLRSACVMMACLKGERPDEDSHGPSHLPVCLRIRHGLRFAVAHRHHGKQMRTGWQVEEPSDMSQRNAAEDNILIEACTTNWMKWDYLEKFYKVIHENFGKSVVPKKWYDPRVQPPSVADPAMVNVDASLSLDDKELCPSLPASVLGERTSDHDEEGEQGGEPRNAQEVPGGQELPSGEDAAGGQNAHGLEPASVPVWRLVRKNYARVTVDDLVEPDHPGYGFVLVVGDQEGYVRKDNSFRTITESTVLGTLIDGQVSIAVIDIGSYIPEPYEGPLKMIQGQPDTTLDDMVDATNVFNGFFLFDTITEDRAYPRKDNAFTTLDNKMIGTFSSDGFAYDMGGLRIGSLADALEEEKHDVPPGEGEEEQGDVPPGEGEEEQGEVPPGQGQEEQGTSVTTRLLTVTSAIYQGDEIPRRVPGDHPLAGLVVTGAALNLHGYADSSGRFRTTEGGNQDVVAHWQQTHENTYAIFDDFGAVANVRRQGTDWVLSEL